MDSYQALSKEQLIDKVKELTIELENVQTEKNKQLEQMSRTDFLTKLNNRSELVERLGYETKRATRTKEPLSLVMFNVDDLKQVNDRYGQSVGDKVLTEIAKIITSSVRVTDIVGRFGGDEFLVVTLETDSKECDSLISRVNEHLLDWNKEHPDPDYGLSVSIGCAKFENGKDLMEVMKEADSRMYINKLKTPSGTTAREN